MTESEKELWLCEFHDAFERGEYEQCGEMFWEQITYKARVSLSKTDWLLRERIANLSLEEVKKERENK